MGMCPQPSKMIVRAGGVALEGLGVGKGDDAVIAGGQ